MRSQKVGTAVIRTSLSSSSITLARSGQTTRIVDVNFCRHSLLVVLVHLATASSFHQLCLLPVRKSYTCSRFIVHLLKISNNYQKKKEKRLWCFFDSIIRCVRFVSWWMKKGSTRWQSVVKQIIIGKEKEAFALSIWKIGGRHTSCVVVSHHKHHFFIPCTYSLCSLFFLPSASSPHSFVLLLL